ncbi:MAG: response regulator [Ktedonobacteraceae bacterium]|nr:response regulator [Ktedonobacteraceae bacterium]
MKKRILLVDDDCCVRMLLQDFLQDEAYEVDTAIDGLDALEKLNQRCYCYDLILLDLTMPRMSGLQLLEELQERAFTLLPLVIALSGDRDALRQASNMGIGGALTKPFDLEMLLARLDSLCSVRPSALSA